LIDPDSTSPVIVLLVLFVLHALFAAAKEAIASVKKSRRLQLIEEGQSSAQIIDKLAEDPTRLLATEQLLLKFLGFFIVVFAVYIYADPLAQILSVNNFIAILIITLLTAFGTFLFGELIPKEIARSYAEPIAFRVIYPFNWLSHAVTPLVKVIIKVGQISTGRWYQTEEQSSSTLTEEDLRSFVDVGEEEGLLKEDAKEMIYSIFDLGDTLAREVMVPRIDIVAVEGNTSIEEEVIDVIIQAGHSRVPVYIDSIDNVVGILYVKDLLVHWRNGDTPASVHSLARSAYYVPETKPVSDLLRELQAKKVHIAIVVDEYGGTAGVVTIEDILEEIVGEIQDEHDADEFYMEYISDDEYIFTARMDLDDINNIMSVDLPTGESDTLGGLIYNILGRIPKVGDTIDGQSFGNPNLSLTVLSVDGRRIKTAKIQRIREEIATAEKKASIAEANPSALMNGARKSFSESSSQI